MAWPTLDWLPVPALFRVAGREFSAGQPAVMGIVNVNDDSFYAPARKSDVAAALQRVGELVEEGADIIDVGAVRAGQEGDWVDADAELARLLPVLTGIREQFPDVLISVDTWRSEVAAQLSGLVDIVNDTWAGHDPNLVTIAAEFGAGYVVSHTGGLPPRTDPVGIDYGAVGVVADVVRELADGARRATEAGIPAERVLVDPTLDFGKTTLNSLELVAATDVIVGLGFPVLMAISRKDFIGETLDLPVDERLEGSLAATAIAGFLGATVFRAHDVAATRRVVNMTASIRGDRPPIKSERGR